MLLRRENTLLAREKFLRWQENSLPRHAHREFASHSLAKGSAEKSRQDGAAPCVNNTTLEGRR
jgi:hypothetical protein